MEGTRTDILLTNLIATMLCPLRLMWNAILHELEEVLK